MEQFSTQWFIAYYISLGTLLISYGFYLLVKTSDISEFLMEASKRPTPPVAWQKVLKYLLLFTLPGLILSFTPFSWIELLFSVWSLIIIYTAGKLVLLWPHTSKAIRKTGDQLPRKIRVVAVNMISIGIVLYLLCYVLIERTGSV